MNPTNKPVLVCAETGETITGKFFVATRSNDPARYVVVSEAAIQRIPIQRRGQDRRNFSSGGFDIHTGTLGENHQVNYQTEDEGRKRKSSFIFSVSGVTAKELLPNTHPCFPCKNEICLGEEGDLEPVNMGAVVPIT
jgi:hypothetical protein